MLARNKFKIEPTNKARFIEFRGDHPYFVEGVSYSIAEYSAYTKRHCLDGGVKEPTIKGRLGRIKYCEPQHLLHADEYTSNRKSSRPPRKGEREKALATPRCESMAEALSMKWLKTILVRVK